MGASIGPAMAAANPYVAGAGMVATGLGALFGAGGASASAEASSNNMMYQAMIAQYNAQLDLQKADMASRAGEVEAATKGMQTRAAIGSQRAETAAGGVDVNTGSAKAVQDATQRLGMMDAETIRSNAAKTAYGYQVDAVNEINQSFADQAGAKNAKRAGRIGAMTSLLSGASSLGNAWARFQNP